MSFDYITAIDNAKVYDVAIKTPLVAASKLSKRLDNNIQFKREDLQPVYSFKLRGAYNKIATLAKKIRIKVSFVPLRAIMLKVLL